MIVACFHSFFFHTLAAPKEDGQLKNWLRGLWKRFTYVQETGHEDGKAWKSIRTQVSIGPSNSFRLDNRWSWQNKASQRTASSAFRIIQTYLDYVWVHLCASRNLVTCDILWFMFLVTFRDTRLLHVAFSHFASLLFLKISDITSVIGILLLLVAGLAMLFCGNVLCLSIQSEKHPWDTTFPDLASFPPVMSWWNLIHSLHPAPCTRHPDLLSTHRDSPWLTSKCPEMSWDVLRSGHHSTSHQPQGPAEPSAGAELGLEGIGKRTKAMYAYV